MQSIEYDPPFAVMAKRATRPNIIASIFSNADDGLTGPDDYMPPTRFFGIPLPGWIHGSVWWLRLSWWLRNPAHDLAFYWLGLVGLPVHTYAKDPRHVFALDAEGREFGGWNYGTVHRIHSDSSIGFPRPFVSWAGAWLIYAGWRFPDGALGIKIRRNSAG